MSQQGDLQPVGVMLRHSKHERDGLCTMPGMRAMAFTRTLRVPQGDRLLKLRKVRLYHLTLTLSRQKQRSMSFYATPQPA